MQQDIAQAKAKLRTQYRARRRALDQQFVLEASRAMHARLWALEAFERARCIFIFVSMPGEPDTLPLISHLLEQGRAVCVPRCIDGGQMELVQITDLADLAEGFYGIREPLPGLPAVAHTQVDFCLIPAIACGLDGSRLGQGGGYYDRFLARYQGACAALCFEDFLCETLPGDRLDQPVPVIVTERRTILVAKPHTCEGV